MGVFTDRLAADMKARAKKHDRPRAQQALTAYRKTGALVSFVDDDGNPAVLTKLLPLSITHGIPFTLAIPSTAVGTAGMTAARLLDLQNTSGWEIASHGRTHVTINSTLTDAEIVSEVVGSAQDLRGMGFDVTTMVWPYGANDVRARRVASEHYTAGCSTSAQFNKSPLLPLGLGRHQFPTAGWTLDQYTALVDQAVTNGTWLIFMLHCGTQTAADDAMLNDIIAYVKSKPVPIVTVRDGIATHGNIINIGDGERYWGRDGTNNIVNYDFRPADPLTGNETFGFDTLPATIPKGKTWMGAIVTATERNKSPRSTSAGVLLGTHAHDGCGYQTYFTAGRVYTRGELENGTGWGAWVELVRGRIFPTTVTARTIPAHSAVDVAIFDAGMLGSATYVATPSDSLEAGILWQAWSHGNGAIKLRLANVTAAEVSLVERSWSIRMILA